MENSPFVSIIIPCRNEEKYIERCLSSVIGQDYPKEKMEIFVIDGASEDKTKEIAERFSADYSFIKILDNPQKFTPFGLNIGIKKSSGSVIVRLDCHAAYQKDYILKCLKYLNDYQADNVGGVAKAMSGEDGFFSKAIAISLEHSFGAGSSHFRTGVKEPKWVDTVFCGCYKKEVFDKIGLFNENLIRSQDYEFNLRLRKAGGKILLAPDIVSCYWPKGKISDFFKHNLVDGIWSIYPLKFVKTPFSIRHYIPLAFVSSLLISVILSLLIPLFKVMFFLIIVFYLLASLYFSYKISKKEKDFKYLFLMPVVFAVRHFGYGLGSIAGLIKLLE